MGTLENKKRKDTMMTKSYEKWESEIDWSKRTSVVGGPIFYDFVKTKAIPALDDGLRQLEATRDACEDKMRRWGGIAERAGKLADCFSSLTENEDFMVLIRDFDAGTARLFKDENIPTLSCWLRIGKRLTDALRGGTSVPAKYATELAMMKKEIANATSVRDIFRAFISASDNDYRLRCAPERFRMRVFRDLSRDFSEIVKAGANVNLCKTPDFLRCVNEQVKIIVAIANKMQCLCRRAKKDMKREGGMFWSKLDRWNALVATL